jgi:hypothetical protein
MRQRAFAVVLTWCCAALGCTDAQLYHLSDIPARPNKVAFTGQVCTDNPAERKFPLRVVFLVDASPLGPTGLSGPALATLNQKKTQAIRDVVSILRGPDSEFAVIRYGGSSQIATEDGFTNSTALVNEAAGQLQSYVVCDPAGGGCRRLSNAISQASSLITGDLLSSTRGPRSRTSYVVVLIQVGPVDQYTSLGGQVLDHDALLTAQSNGCLDLCTSPGDPAGCNEACTLSRRVTELRNFVLDNGGANFQFHTVDVSPLSIDQAERDATELLLTNLSFAGSGEYSPICTIREDGTTIPANCNANNLSLIGLDIQSARNVFVKKSLIVTNLNARHTNDGEVADSDQDGIPDDKEGLIGTDPTMRDTDGDGIGDKVEALLSTVGLDPLVAEDPRPPVCLPVTPTQDTDGDGLTDCEEVLLRLDPTLFDTDADGFPDLVEFVAGTNFLENDTLVDSDFDGEPNGPELRQHSDPRSHDAKARNELSYLYREDDLGIREVKFTTQPREITGAIVENVGPQTGVGNGLLTWLPDLQALAWRDPADEMVGEAVIVDQAGTYQLFTGCAVDVGQPPEELEACAGKFIEVTVTPQLMPPYPFDELLRVAIAERQCTDFRVRNVTLVESQAADGRPLGHNDIRIYFNQVPIDRPESFGIFRVAQYTYTYREGENGGPGTKDPDIADQPVESFRFVLFGD